MNLSFEIFFPLWLISILFITASIIIIISYLLIPGKVIDNKYRILLLILKLCAVCMLIFALFQPYVIATIERSKKGTLAILVDTSPSMTFKDKDGLSRLDKINTLFNDKKNNFLDELRKDHTVKIFSFADNIIPFISQKTISFSPSGYNTKLVNSLESVSKDLKEDNLSSIILFSDGQDPLLNNFLVNALDFEYPVNTVKPDGPEKLKDIHILRVQSEETVSLNQDTEIKIYFKNNGYNGEYINIILMEENKEIAKQKYLLKTDGEENASLKFNAKTQGWHKYTIKILPMPDEIITVNNVSVFYMHVIHDKIKLLFIEGTPGFDFKFIKKVLAQDNNLETNFLVYKPDPAVKKPESRHFFDLDESFLTIFPSEEELYQYNIIFLGNVPYSYFTDNDIRKLKNFVDIHGGGLLCLIGENSTGYFNSELEKILPVKFTNEPIYFSNNFLPVLTREGNIHPVTRLDANPLVNNDIWKNLPELSGSMSLSISKPGAAILALDPEQKYNQAFLIFIALEEYGRGKTMVINATGLWRWDFLMWGIKNEQSYAAKFWSNVIRWLGRTEEKKNFSIQTDKRLYNAGDIIHIRASLYDKNFSPIKKAKLECVIKNEASGEELSFEIIDIENLSGIYGGEIKISNPQEALITARALVDKKVVGTFNLHITVIPPLEEYKNLDLNEKGLKELSSLTGGTYFTSKTLKNMPDKLKRSQYSGSYLEKIELWDTIWYLIIFITFLITEWYLRKLKGMD